ncbi:MAG: 16S rRNA (uracil(1498)-N(3))-methyltransferase [Rhizobiales bacterium]|nr:16S rRNA (uracil(1498)-N(3))-methyltransferase [Hyphomicrobiales bacterium]
MERYDYKTQRIYVEADLATGTQINADRAQANYLLNVLRLKSGANLLLFNGRDGEWLASLEPTGRKSCLLTLEKQTRAQPKPYNLVYLFAPLKQARLDYMVQKAVEMGAGVFQPVFTHHTQVSTLKTERIIANSIEAAEQCGILSIPKCNEPLKIDKMISNWKNGAYSDYTLVFCDENAPEDNPAESLSKLNADSSAKKIALLIGPEGGFSTEERTLLLAQEFVLPIALGPRILRADTAAVAALALIQSFCGDWAASGG